MTGNRSRFSLVMTIVAVVVAVLLSTFNTPTVTTAQGATGSRPVASNPTGTGGDGKGGSVPAGLVLLYNQTGTQDLDVTSQDFEAAFDAFDNQAADDFVVPAGQTWLVDSVFANGAYSATPSGQTWDVFFYSNNAGLPGTLVGSALAATATTDVAGDVTIPVSPAVSLPAGTYWVSVQINMAFTPGGQWFWGEINGITNNDFAWQNPGGGFGANCPTWNRNCAFLQAQDDLIFQLYGTIAGGPTSTPTATATNTPVGPTSTATATATNTPVGPTSTATATATNTPVGPTNTATATPGSGNRFCSSTPITIPDANPTGATGTITVGSAGTISDLNVVLTGTHTWVGDLRFNLSNGTTNVTFYDQPGVPASTFGCSGDNLPGVIADDEGVNGTFENSCQNATPAYTPGGSYTNNNPLSAFDGATTNATWTLTASDLAAGDTGTIDSWCVEFGGGAGPTPTPTITPTAPGQVPDINVNPGSFTETHNAPPQVTTDTMNIGNTGTGVLNWTIAEDDTATEWVPGPLVPGANSVETVADGGAPAPATNPAPVGKPGYVPGMNGGVLYDNGPLVNVPGGGAGGADASRLQDASLLLSTYGFGHALSTGFRVADDFTVPAGETWTINSATFFAYQTGSTTTSTINNVNVRIWDGPPGQGGSTVVYGDTTTNRLANSTWSNAYRDLESAPGDASRPVMANTTTINTVLTAGTYWIDWQTGGTLGSGPWAPPISINGTAVTGNAVQFDPGASTWNAAIDTGAAAQQGFPFILEGTGGGGGGACSAPTDIPWLTVAPLNGSTAGGGSTPTTLTYNSASLAQGVYTGTLCIASNDPDEALVTVPITLNVGLPTAIDLSSFTTPMSGINPADLAAAGLLLLAGAVLVLRRK